MEMQKRIRELREAIEESHSYGDWMQRHPRPWNPEDSGWGSSDIVATSRATEQREKIARVYDSGNMNLVIVMRRHAQALLEALELHYPEDYADHSPQVGVTVSAGNSVPHQATVSASTTATPSGKFEVVVTLTGNVRD